MITRPCSTERAARRKSFATGFTAASALFAMLACAGFHHIESLYEVPNGPIPPSVLVGATERLGEGWEEFEGESAQFNVSAREVPLGTSFIDACDIPPGGLLASREPTGRFFYAFTKDHGDAPKHLTFASPRKLDLSEPAPASPDVPMKEYLRKLNAPPKYFYRRSREMTPTLVQFGVSPIMNSGARNARLRISPAVPKRLGTVQGYKGILLGGGVKPIEEPEDGWLWLVCVSPYKNLPVGAVVAAAGDAWPKEFKKYGEEAPKLWLEAAWLPE